jgi:hypothetical protein
VAEGMNAYSDGGMMYFHRNVFRNNTEAHGSLSSAGGLVAGGAFSVENNLFANNSGVQIGGAYLSHHDSGHGYIRSNSFSGNDGATSTALRFREFVGMTLRFRRTC